MSGTRGDRAEERGSTLMLCYTVLAVLATLTTAFIALPMPDKQLTQWQLRSVQILYLAESAFDRAVVFLRQPNFQINGAADNLQGPGPSGSPCPEIAYAQLTSPGGYEADIDTVPGRPGVYRIVAAGYADETGAQNRVLEAFVRVTPRSPFRYAAFGDAGVTLTGNASTDSYDSSQGAYRSRSAGAEGHIGTNGTSAGDITLSGNTVVGGDVWVGPGGDPATAVRTGPNVTILGTAGALPLPEPMPPVTIPGGLAYQGDLSVSGNNTVTLAGGTYWYKSISISGNGRLEFSGPAVLYLSGQLSVSGNGIATPGDLPPNLTIYVAGDDNVNFIGNANFFGAVYAPKSQVSLSGNGNLFGSLIGRTVTHSGNGAIHYDLDLQNDWRGAAVIPNRVQVLSLSEMD